MLMKKEIFQPPFSGLASFFLLLVMFFVTDFRLLTADEADAASSPNSFNYLLVGIAHFEGTSYASLIDRQTKYHFLLSSDKPNQGLKLISVGGDDSPAGPSAILEKDGVSVQLKVVAVNAADQDIAVDFSTPTTSSASQLSIQPAPASVKSDMLKPPRGAELPLVFQAYDPKKLNLTADQQQTINQLRNDFLNAISAASPSNPARATSNPSSSNSLTASASASNSTSDSTTAASADANSTAAASSTTANGQGSNESNTPQLKRWKSAQAQSDEQLRTTLGWQAYSDYQMSLLK